MSMARGVARKSITPVLNHAERREPCWWPQFFSTLSVARTLRSASKGTCRQSVPPMTSASGSESKRAYGGWIHAVSTSEMQTCRSARSSQRMASALVTP
jgi:hypothetical protein